MNRCHAVSRSTEPVPALLLADTRISKVFLLAAGPPVSERGRRPPAPPRLPTWRRRLDFESVCALRPGLRPACLCLRAALGEWGYWGSTGNSRTAHLWCSANASASCNKPFVTRSFWTRERRRERQSSLSFCKTTSCCPRVGQLYMQPSGNGPRVVCPSPCPGKGTGTGVCVAHSHLPEAGWVVKLDIYVVGI